MFGLSAVVSSVILSEKKKNIEEEDKKRKGGSANLYQRETEAVEGTGKVNISDVEVPWQKGNKKRGQKEAELKRDRKT